MEINTPSFDNMAVSCPAQLKNSEGNRSIGEDSANVAVSSFRSSNGISFLIPTICVATQTDKLSTAMMPRPNPPHFKFCPKWKLLDALTTSCRIADRFAASWIVR